jgi:hypothetical protein
MIGTVLIILLILLLLGGSSPMEAQQPLGIWSEWRVGHCSGCPDYPGADGAPVSRT